jgi:hypothetical protein
MTENVEASQRFSRRHRCPVCGGCETEPRGTGKRCYGYISKDGKYARCSQKPGTLPQGPDGLWPHGLFSTDSDPGIEATYDYRDETGRLLFQVVRKRGKQFRQRKLKSPELDPNDLNSWDWSAKGTRKVLFKLPELIAELQSGVSTVLIMEGEKDVLTAWELGFVATCNPGGAGKWRAVEKQARDILSGIRVVVVQDNDDETTTPPHAGQVHAKYVAASLGGAAILAPPEPCKDFTEWVLGGATSDVIDAAIDVAPKLPVSVVASNGAAHAQTSFASSIGIDLVQNKGQNAPIAENVARLLCQHADWNGGPRLDSYSDRIYWPKNRPKMLHPGSDAFSKTDRVAVQAWCIEHNVAVGLDICEEGLRSAAKRNEFDSLIEWVGSLPEWDKVPRLDRWLPTYFGCKDDPYHRSTGRSWLRACIERALLPGLLVDIVPVLIGSQRSNKNYAIATLFGSDRLDSPWLSVMSDFKPDDLKLKRLSTTRWILHDDEFKARDPKLLDKIKSWVSMTDEQYLAKFENDLTVRLRRALLVCSSNDRQVLFDMTGNRRWVTWEVDAIKIDDLHRDRLQLFAEAKASSSWRNGLDFDLIAENTAQSEVVDPLRERLLRLCTEPRRDLSGLTLPAAWSGWVTSDALCEMLGVSPEKADQNFAVRLGRAVSGIEGMSRRTGRGAGCIRFYLPPDPISAEKVRKDLNREKD